ncbi:MAG: CTP-dependent riboflavin kinase [Candidatus Diapherotrites archaeon]|nr:CTP-dependent riboflavin kinase [Candidatus Diapherotrites archaeon]
MSLIVKGRLVQGSKEGAYWVSQYRSKLMNACGFDPFPGTLNIEANEVPRYPSKANFISSFTQEGKEFGAVWCYPCVILNARGAVVVPEATHHSTRIVEVIAPYPLKSKFDLKTGDYVEVEVDEAK